MSVNKEENRRCVKCLIPTTYPHIKLDDNLLCDFCRKEKKIYKGKDALKNDIEAILKNSNPERKYDCLIGFSGGRDSTYLLHFLKSELDFKIGAFCSDNRLLPKTTMTNIQKICKDLGVDLIIRQHDYLKKCVKNNISAWLKYPDPRSLITFCTGCRLGMHKLANEVCKEKQVPILIWGGTPFEGGSYKTGLVKTNPLSGRMTFLKGYMNTIIKNPHLVSNFNSNIIQVREFFNQNFWIKRYQKRNGIIKISPFHKYIKWNEQEINDVLIKIGWEKNPDLDHNWRGDCLVGPIRQYLYKKILGYNDFDDHIWSLIRDGQISRNEGIRRIKDKKSNEDSINFFLSEIGIREKDAKDIVKDFKPK